MVFTVVKWWEFGLWARERDIYIYVLIDVGDVYIWWELTLFFPVGFFVDGRRGKDCLLSLYCMLQIFIFLFLVGVFFFSV